MQRKQAIGATSVALYAVLVAGCASLRMPSERPVSQALAPAVSGYSARYLAEELDQQATGVSGFRLLTLSSNALLSRVALADRALRSIDLQYYIFKNDATGRLLAQRLLLAADRGVRVRLLLDDFNLSGQRSMLDALDAHPFIEVRLFNPFQTREPTLPSKLVQVLLEGSRLNRRMHNKSFIVDNQVAIIGGRNIGDDYFDASDENNFRDLDLLAIGPVVREASRSFDDYWNSDVALPVTEFSGTGDTHDDLDALRIALATDARAFDDSQYQENSLDELPDGATADRRGEWFWGAARLLADAPEKAENGGVPGGLRIAPILAAIIDDSREQLLLMSPYFIPSEQDVASLQALAGRGVAVRVLTNSLAATDEAAVYAKYAKRRIPLLAAGVELFELRPALGVAPDRGEHGESSGVSLHAKAFVMDARVTFVGSMNLDPRSAVLNTEMGLLVDSRALAEAVSNFFAAATTPAGAYRLQWRKSASGSGRLLWHSTDAAGQPLQIHHEPDTRLWQRIKMRFMRLLPIESLL